MKYQIIIIPFLPALGMALFPFILVKTNALKNNYQVILHEKIHLTQQGEMLILPFYIVYLFHYLINLIRFKNHTKAYLNIVFEKEAYAMDKYPDYLQQRRFWAWREFLAPNSSKRF